MFFKSVKNEIFNDVIIPSIFFDMYIPIASGDQIKVYLLGYKSAYFNNGVNSEEINNRIIANMVGISEEEVEECWKFWDEKGAIKIHPSNQSYSIEFLDIKSDFINSRYGIEHEDVQDESVDDMSTEYAQMYNEIEIMLGRILTPNEKLTLLDAIYEYKTPTDLVIYAFNRSFDENGKVKSISYVIGILKSWFDNGIKSINEAELLDEYRNKQLSLHTTIFKNLGFYRKPSKAEEKIMDKWINEFEMGMDVILLACSKSANITNPNLKYFDSIITGWYEKGLKTVEDVEKDEREYAEAKKAAKSISNSKKTKPAKSGKGKTNFHNFDQKISSSYSDEEFSELIKNLNRNK